ncbi:MAG: ATP-binding protein [Oscillospiraceae bacterium]|nr:ATP-binding protein [Oscillospiraceae bacterium]
MTKSEIRHTALQQMEQRRQSDERMLLERHEEIERKIPVIAELDRVKSATAAKLSRAVLEKNTDTQAVIRDIQQNQQECDRLIREELVKAGYPEDYLKMHYLCDKCKDTGFVNNVEIVNGERVAGKGNGMCDCLKRLMAEIAAKDLNNSANMPYADFDTFDLDYYRDASNAGMDCYSYMATVKRRCMAYAEKFDGHSSGMLFIGAPGLGKTHLAMAIAKEVIRRGYVAVYGNVIDLLSNLEDEKFGRADAGQDTMGVLMDADLLIIDDLGSEQHTSFNESALYSIINSRINLDKPVIVSTNLTEEELADTYNARILSRIFNVYDKLPFFGRDIRALKAKGARP